MSYNRTEDLKALLKILKYFFLAQLLFFVNVGSAHDAETNKPFEKMHAHRTFNAHAHAGWESRYFSEGRDALHGKSLWNSSLELGYDHFSGGVWYGRSSNHQYDELQYNIALTQEIDEYSFYAGYTHLLFPKDDASDDEWSLGISYEGLPFDLITSLDACYSMDAKGTFMSGPIPGNFILRKILIFPIRNIRLERRLCVGRAQWIEFFLFGKWSQKNTFRKVFACRAWGTQLGH